MSTINEIRMDVRAHIATETRAIHEALHHDPVLTRLTEPSITQHEYIVAMNVLSCFYQSVERERLRFGLWQEFTLSTECDALSRDLGEKKACAVELELANEFELLGGLYVAHGASFGRSVFRRNLRTALADLPRSFVSQSTSKTTWRLMVDTLERYGQDPKYLRDLLNGAFRSFEVVVQASQACQSGGYELLSMRD